MPPALDRLLASPSALRLLRSIVNTSDLPAACATTAKCCHPLIYRRKYFDGRKPSSRQNWRRWKSAEETNKRDDVRRVLKAGGSSATLQPKLDTSDHDTWSQGIADDYDDAKWAATLARRERHYRLAGIRAVWKSLRHRGHRLPIEETPDADFLWGTFIRNLQIVDSVIDHATELLRATGKTYPRLYDFVMSYWLQRDPRSALDLHHQMLIKLNLRKLPLRDLMRLGRTTFRPAAWEALLDIYRNSNERDLYDEAVIPLIEKGNFIMARRWHSLCIFRGDTPSESAASHPVVQIFTAEASTLSNTEVHFEVGGTSKRPNREIGRYNQELMQRLLGRDTAPVRFEDSFCARMFATRTFPPASIIQGLAMVGVNEIGPQAVLAMASRTEPVEELSKRFEELRAAGIALQGCVFSLALEKFAMEQRWHLVRSILDSDQHPDVFGDAEVQRSLLEYYLDQGDYGQAQRTLAILTLVHNDSSAESWNLLLQVYIKRSGSLHVMEVLQDMRSRNVTLSVSSLVAIKGLLRRRQRGRKPILPPRATFDDLRFVTRVFMFVLESGMAAISPSAWREMICRFGMLGRFRELRRLLLWLLCWYAPRSMKRFANLPESPFLTSAKLRTTYPERSYYSDFPKFIKQHRDPLHPIRLLFKPSLQQGLIIWGFRAGLLPNAALEQSMLGPTLAKKHYRERLFQKQALHRLDWGIGLRTLVQLRDLGVNVHYHTVIKALQMQFVVLFGRGRSDKKENRIVERVNNMTYSQYIQEVNKIWGHNLFREPQLLETSLMHKLVWHPRLRRRIKRDTSISLTQFLGPDWQERNHETKLNDDRAAEISHLAALEELQQHFSAQADGSGSGFDFLDHDKTAVIAKRSNKAKSAVKARAL